MGLYLKLLSPALMRARARKGRVRKGQTVLEYSLILALIAIACLTAFTALGNQVITIFSAIITLLDTAQGSH
jgi:Flp pilus assembly pilin Flp